MPSIHRSAMAAALAAGTLLVVSACGPDGPAGDGGTAAPPPASTSATASASAAGAAE